MDNAQSLLIYGSPFVPGPLSILEVLQHTVKLGGGRCCCPVLRREEVDSIFGSRGDLKLIEDLSHVALKVQPLHQDTGWVKCRIIVAGKRDAQLLSTAAG